MSVNAVIRVRCQVLRGKSETWTNGQQNLKGLVSSTNTLLEGRQKQRGSDAGRPCSLQEMHRPTATNGLNLDPNLNKVQVFYKTIRAIGHWLDIGDYSGMTVNFLKDDNGIVGFGLLFF